MGWLRKSDSDGKKVSINWMILKDLEGLDTWNDLSFQKPVLFFKHSTRCSISSMAKDRFERGWIYSEEEIIPVYLDLISYREISNRMADMYGVVHQSPQVLLIKKGECVHSASHNSIDAGRLSLHL